MQRNISDYEFTEKQLGSSPHGRVMIAVEKATKRQLAIKVIKKNLLKNDMEVAQVKREKDILVQLNGHGSIL